MCLPLCELKVIRDNQRSGAAGLYTHLCMCVFMCFKCGVVKGLGGSRKGDGVSKQFAKEQVGEMRGSRFVLDCLGPDNL